MSDKLGMNICYLLIVLKIIKKSCFSNSWGVLRNYVFEHGRAVGIGFVRAIKNHPFFYLQNLSKSDDFEGFEVLESLKKVQGADN